MNDIFRTLEMFKKLEQAVQKLYGHYQTLFQEDKEACTLFFEIGLDEKSHVDLIDYQLRTINKNRALFNDVEIDLTQVAHFIAEITNRLSSQQPVSLEEAWQYAMECESSALEQQYNTLISKSNKELGEFIEKLESAEKEHLNKLRIFGKKRRYLDA